MSPSANFLKDALEDRTRRPDRWVVGVDGGR